MYLYSKRAQEHYLTYPIESFFLAKFANSQDGKDFIRSKPDESEKNAKTDRILHDTGILREHAIEALKKCDQKKLSEVLLKNLSKAD